MAIDRGPWNALVDDDGSNLVGSVWNKAAIAGVILDPVDAAIAAVPMGVTGTWTPTDASGAGLTLTPLSGARYWKHDKFVYLVAHFSYPANSNGAAAAFGGFPFPNGPVMSGLVSLWTPQMLFLMLAGASNVTIYTTAGVGRTNAEMAGTVVVVSGSYLIA